MIGPCGRCKHWSLSAGDDMGVCTSPTGVGDGYGFALPIEQCVVSKKTKKAHAGKLGTSSDTRCTKFEESQP